MIIIAMLLLSLGNPEGADLKYLKQYFFEETLTLHPGLLGQGLIPIGIVHHEWHICMDIKQIKKIHPLCFIQYPLLQNLILQDQRKTGFQISVLLLSV